MGGGARVFVVGVLGAARPAGRFQSRLGSSCDLSGSSEKAVTRMPFSASKSNRTGLAGSGAELIQNCRQRKWQGGAARERAERFGWRQGTWQEQVSPADRKPTSKLFGGWPAPQLASTPTHLELVALQGLAVDGHRLERVLGIGEVKGLPLCVDAILQAAGGQGKEQQGGSENVVGWLGPASVWELSCARLNQASAQQQRPGTPLPLSLTLGSSLMPPCMLSEQSDHSQEMRRRWGHMPVMSR